MPVSLQMTLSHLLIHALFSHQKEINRLGKFFSAINCYAALISFLPYNPNLRFASTITSKMMQLIYANRTTQITHMQRLMDLDEDLLVYEYAFPLFVFSTLMV
jgi:hypothetical protein